MHLAELEGQPDSLVRIFGLPYIKHGTHIERKGALGNVVDRYCILARGTHESTTFYFRGVVE